MVASASHTYLNIQAEARDGVFERAIEHEGPTARGKNTVVAVYDAEN